MEKDVGEKVIKPPIKRVTSGKIFKPSKAFLHKNLLQPVVLAFTIWLIVVICFVGGSFIGAAVEPEEIPSAIQHINTWIIPVNFWTIVVNLIWLIPVLIYIPFFVIDLVTSNILLAMGMMMLSPVTISMPLKLFLLVMLDGWTLLIEGLVHTFR